MLEAQIHAISLMRAVHPLPETEPLTLIPRVELTPEEDAMTDEEKASAARVLILGSANAANKQTLSANVNGVSASIQQASARLGAVMGRRIAILRKVMWITTLTIIALLVATFITLNALILQPLARYVRVLPTNEPLDDSRGLREVRMVASAYNDVLKRRNALDAILRSAAETDALTNLPNRYRFEQFLLESGESGYSLAALLFDVNFLKRTNDTQGHLAGDKLLRDAADCISSCFGENCFRFGGDEFAAVVKGCAPDVLKRMLEAFEQAEKEHGVSISYGCAYTDEIGNTTFRKLLDEADRKMYAQKKQVHETH